MADDVQSLLAEARERHQAGELPAAEALYRRALESDGENIDAQYLLGTALLQMGRYPECIELLERVVAARPDVPDAHNNLGVAYKAGGQWESAARSFQAAIKANPEYGQAFFNLGAVMEERDLWADAEKCYRHALDLNSGDAQIRYALAGALRAQEKWPEAEVCYRKLAGDDPGNLALRVHLGFVLVRQKRFDDAEDVFREILALKPDFHEIHNNLSYIYEQQGRLDEAISAARKAVEIEPDYAEGYNNLGTALKPLGRLQEARDCFARAISLQPDFPLAEFNLGTTCLLEGDFAAGWPGYDRRGETLAQQPHDYGRPCWDGSPLGGKTILLHAEQGFGDTFQFIRYAPLVKARGGRVVVHVPKPLRKLLGSCAGIDRLIVEGDELPEFDVQAPLLSLPRIFGTTLKTVPADVPYLFADDNLVKEWQQKLAAVEGFKVGICWQGNPDYNNDADRSISLEHFAPLASVKGVTLISLQKGDGEEQLDRLVGALHIWKPEGDFDGINGAFMDSAAVMQNLDLVVTSDTAIPHLAGALGVPVWVALTHVPEWRWLLDRNDSPWYPGMRLFRQTARGDWPGVFERIATALHDTVQSGRSGTA